MSSEERGLSNTLEWAGFFWHKVTCFDVIGAKKIFFYTLQVGGQRWDHPHSRVKEEKFKLKKRVFCYEKKGEFERSELKIKIVYIR